LIRLLIMSAVLFSSLVHADGKKGNDILLMFQEQETGSEPYQVRMIFKNHLMRIDEGNSDNNFVLFNNKEHVIYSISSDRKSILVINSKQVKYEPPIKLDLKTEKIDSVMFPSVSGKKPQAYKFNVNGETCNLVIAVPGLLDHALNMMRAYYTLLSYEQADAQASIPDDMLNPCDVVNNIVAPVHHLSFGFPIRESSKSGKQRAMIDFDEHYLADEKLFMLPKDYTRFSRQDTN